MNTNQAVIQRFYSAFQKLDHRTMQNCYSDDPVFNDQVFGLLEGAEVFAMWEMLCTNARDFSLEFSNIQLLDEEYATCNWTARYTFSRTGRKVVNKIKAHMRIQDGKITEHTDEFDIWKWSRQALGLPGWLLGWSGFMKNRIRLNARNNLAKYMESNQPK
jgi:ketosteroid isomerase-like protein